MQQLFKFEKHGDQRMRRPNMLPIMSPLPLQSMPIVRELFNFGIHTALMKEERQRESMNRVRL
jgi:hypothetical protein